MLNKEIKHKTMSIHQVITECPKGSLTYQLTPDRAVGVASARGDGGAKQGVA